MYTAFDSKPNFVENIDDEIKQAFVYTAWITCKSNVWPLQINKQVDLVCTSNHFKMFILYFTPVLVLFSGSIIHSLIHLPNSYSETSQKRSVEEHAILLFLWKDWILEYLCGSHLHSLSVQSACTLLITINSAL